MKKIIIPIFVIFSVLSISFLSCKKDKFTEEDALQQQINLINYNDSLARLRDSLNHYGGIIQYTVNVVSAGDASFNKSMNAIDSVKITVSQYGQVMTKYSVNGQAIFNDLRIGTAAVSIENDNYTDVDLLVDLTPHPIPYGTDTVIENWYNVLRTATTQIPIFPLTGSTLATIKGKVTYEKNMVNTAPEEAGSVEVIGVIDVDNPYFAANYLMTTPTGFAGSIIKIAYSTTVSRTTTSATGDYTLLVPSSADGLPIKVLVSEFTEDQTILLNTKWGQNVYGEQTVRTIFSSDNDNVTASPSMIPRVAAAYVTFSAPTGSANLLPASTATATAVISESGIETIIINDAGSGYTQAPVVAISGGDGQSASATASIANGQISGFTVTNAGTGYTNNNPPVVTLLYHGDPGAGVQAQAFARLGYSVSDYTVTNGGAGYTSVPAVTISSGAGSGATAKAVMDGYVSKLTLTNGGSGYRTTPQVIFSGANGYNAAATATLTTANPISEIYIPENNTTYFDKANPPTANQFVISGAGSGAAGTFTMNTKGIVWYINPATFVGGAGYDPVYPPNVTITGDGFGATADATVNPGGDITVNLLTQGYGYSYATVTIDGSPAGPANNASATVVIGVTVASVTVTNGGTGYVSGSTGVSFNGTTIPGTTVYYDRQVQTVTLTNGGTNFTAAPTVSFISTDGYGSGATATTEVKYFVEDVQVLTEGSNYEFNAAHPVVVSIEAPPAGGTQATANAVSGNGKVKEIVLNNGGTGYTAAPNVILNGGGYNTEAVVTATISGGSVTGFTISNAGSGYTSTPTVSILTYINAASVNGTAHPQAGQVTSVVVTDPGQGYVTEPNVEFQVVNGDGSGTGATATATLDGSGRVASVTVTNGGSGYYTAPAVKLVVPNYNLTAKGIANVSVDGHVTGVTLVDAAGNVVGASGQGYVEIPTVTFTESVAGMGTGASGIATVTNGQVTGVIMTNQGEGYLGQNAYVAFGAGADAAGKPVTLYSPVGNVGTNNGFNVEAAKTYILDIDLGTGLRTVQD